MEREVKTYVLKRSDDEAAPRKLLIDYAAALNSQQLAAVTAGEGPSLVIAGAGSGKTRTLVYRVAYLIDSGVDPSNILLLTFTRKSAQEMVQRAGELIGARSERVCGGTFHSVANLLLRRYGRSIGVEPGPAGVTWTPFANFHDDPKFREWFGSEQDGTPDGPKMIEMAARLSGGDFCESLVPLGTGINYVETAIRIAIGEQPDLARLVPTRNRCVANRYFFADPGRLVRIEGVDAIRGEPWLVKIVLRYGVGDVIPPTTSHAERAGVFVVVGDDRAEVQARIDRVYQAVRFVVE